MTGTVFKPPEWAVNHAPADNTVATIGRAAETNATHYVTSITCCLEGAANEPALIFQLRDSTAGAGNVLWTGKLANAAGTAAIITLGGLNIRGVKGQAVTLETTAAPAASSSVTVAMTGYTEMQVV